MGARRHDDLVGRVGRQRAFRHDLDQLVTGQIAEIVECLHAGLAESNQHRRRQAFRTREFITDFQFLAAAGEFLILARQIGPCPLPQLLGDFLVEAFDLGQVVQRHEGHFLDRREAPR